MVVFYDGVIKLINKGVLNFLKILVGGNYVNIDSVIFCFFGLSLVYGYGYMFDFV